MLKHAQSTRDKVVKHCNHKEYFDVLTYAQKCIKIFTKDDSPVELVTFKNQSHHKAFEIVKDCYIYSSIAYLQLNQHEQAISLLSEVITSDGHNVQSLIIRSRAYEMLGLSDKALADLKQAKAIDPLNTIVTKSIDKLTKQKEHLTLITSALKGADSCSQLKNQSTRNSSLANDVDNVQIPRERLTSLQVSLHPSSPSHIRMNHE